MKKLFGLLCVILVISTSICFAVSNFSDVSNDHWAFDTINEMKEAGILNGYEDGTFKPDQAVTREEFAQIVFKLNGSQKADSETIQNYYDVKNDRWSYDAVQLIGNSIKETSDGYVYFYPERPIQRQEVAKVISDFYHLREKEVVVTNDKEEVDDGILLKFEDINLVNKNYVDAVQNVYEDGLMKGISETEFSPESPLTRAQAATLLSRINEKYFPKPEAKVGNDIDFGYLKLENSKGNLIYSPLSIKYGLKLLTEGAAGNTKTQIDNLVGGITPTKYKNIDKVLSLANSVFIRDRYNQYVKEEYKKAVSEKYDAELIVDKFENANNINNWISDKTLGIIKNVITDDIVQDENTEMVLINALAIDMAWASKFDTEHTYGRPFYKEDGTSINATTMSETFRRGENSYYKDDKITAVTLKLKKYDETSLEFIAIMPNENLADYIKNVSSKDIENIVSNSKKGFMLSIPKFKYDYSLAFENDLKAQGITDAFDAYNADFTNMTSNPIGLFVSKAIHKADIDFSEDGIKAAAITAFIMADKAVAIENPVPSIEINKPFMYIIRDSNNGEIWFVGQVYEPNLWEKDKAAYNR